MSSDSRNECLECGKLFASTFSLDRHFTRIHKREESIPSETEDNDEEKESIQQSSEESVKEETHSSEGNSDKTDPASSNSENDSDNSDETDPASSNSENDSVNSDEENPDKIFTDIIVKAIRRYGSLRQNIINELMERGENRSNACRDAYH